MHSLQGIDAATMPKKIVTVDKLSAGVYITELDRPWVETPFMFQGFKLSSQPQYEGLKKFCKYVVIDTDKGADISGNPFSGGPKRPTVLETIKDKVTYEEKAEVKQELPAARQAHVMTTGVLQDVFGSVQAGKALDGPRVREAVTSVTDSVVRNPDAMMLLAKMKEQSENTLDRALGVSIYMITFGRFLHLPREQLDLLGMLGLLQDVGKLRLPPELLNKKEALSDIELKVCRSHIRHSIAILEKTSGLPPELPALAALHHERVDGSGYPAGLKAEQIGLFGGIAGIVDCFDALTGPRPYGDAIPPSDALNMLYHSRDALFDGPLVEQFIQCIGIYPIGGLVELHSGEIGIVIARNQMTRLFPRVMVVLDFWGKPLKPTKIIEKAGIKRTLAKGSVDIDPSEYFL
jgi:HD-GYP domain-containing protein (c-di-GMP phosphodiesterase class II)